MRVTSKGQVTIPKPFRDWAGIGPGSNVAFERGRDGTVVLRRVENDSEDRRAQRMLDDYFERLRHGPKPTMSAEDLMELVRGPFDDVDDR